MQLLEHTGAVFCSDSTVLWTYGVSGPVSRRSYCVLMLLIFL